MKLFRTASSRRRQKKEITAVDEFTFHMPTQKETRNTRLEIECFKKKMETKQNSMKNDHINSLESLRSDSDSDYDSMPRSEDNDSMNKFRLHDTIPKSCNNNNSISNQPIESVRDIMIKSSDDVAKVLLFPEEEWARNAKNVHWSIKFNKHWKSMCLVTETSIGGSCIKTAEAKIVEDGEGSIVIIGRFKRLENPDFELHLSTTQLQNNIRKEYIMSGDLYQGDMCLFKHLELTHFAAILK